MKDSEANALRSRIQQKGWTPGKKDILPLLEKWPEITADDQGTVLIALAKMEEAACSKVLALWSDQDKTLRGAWARSLARAILNNKKRPHLDWLAENIGAESDARTRKGFIQAVGAAFQAGHTEGRPELARALIRVAATDLEDFERKALVEALAVSGEPGACDVIKRLAGASDSFVKEKLVLARDTARASEDGDISIEIASALETHSAIFRFIPGLERLANRSGVFALSKRLSDGSLLVESGSTWHDVSANHLWKTVEIVLDSLQDGSEVEVAAVLASRTAVIRGWTRGLSEGSPVRIRWGRGGGRTRSDVWKFAEALAKCTSELLNDGREAHWDLHIVEMDGRKFITLEPLAFDDQRWLWRTNAVEGASQSTLAAALVKLADPQPGESVLDPFCGAGTELLFAESITRGLRLTGADVDANALCTASELARAAGANVDFLNCDALELSGQFDVIVTNPPFGMRTARGGAREILEQFFGRVRSRLTRRGRFVLLSHAPVATAQWARAGGLRLAESIPVKLGMMDCELQRFE